jgi:hypothetical protein
VFIGIVSARKAMWTIERRLALVGFESLEEAIGLYINIL